jgi:hypothetical protein
MPQDDDASVSSSGGTASEDGERLSQQADKSTENTLSEPDGRGTVEKRIVARIVEICSPGKTGKTSRLMQNIQVPTLLCF